MDCMEYLFWLVVRVLLKKINIFLEFFRKKLYKINGSLKRIGKGKLERNIYFVFVMGDKVSNWGWFVWG